MNECIDSTMGRNPRMLAVLLASDDPRTSWSFQRSLSISRSMEDKKTQTLKIVLKGSMTVHRPRTRYVHLRSHKSS